VTALVETVQGARVSIEEISKRFGATQALDDVSLEIEPGTIHALVGENGAGKSTLGKIIGGVYVADGGVLRVDGVDVGRWDPPAALAAGIATIQQELSLVPAQSVAENVFLGIERARFGILVGSVLDRYRELDERVGFGLPGEVPVSALRLADRQKVEIMRALARGARLIVLDEPTSSLSKDESNRLHALMRTLQQHGRTLVYVSHFLDEVLDIADTVTIMRDGRVTRTAPVATETKDSLVVGMLGRRLELNFPPLPPVADDARVIFEARQMSGALPKEISFAVRAGEVIGLAGLVGSGRTEIARMIAGADAVTSGEMLLDGKALPKLRPHQAIGRGVVMLPEDRRALGLVMTQNARENITLPRLSTFRRSGAVDLGAERGAARAIIERLHIVPATTEGAIRNYSGGNQQKALFAKWTLELPNFIVLDEPTRGVDIGAKQSIYEAIVHVAASGAAVLLISSELEEVLAMSHRTLLVSNGAIIGEVAHGELDADEALALIFAGNGAEVSSGKAEPFRSARSSRPAAGTEEPLPIDRQSRIDRQDGGLRPNGLCPPNPPPNRSRPES
jgi:ABC-type sugar transport system ATPase subunit